MSVVKCLVGGGVKIQTMAIGPDLLTALLYYLDNLWNPAEGDDKKKPVQFQNFRKAEELEVPDASQGIGEGKY